MADEEISSVFLMPGDYKISKKPHVISTILGSCVSVCLYHPQYHFGGMNHFMLPSCRKRSEVDSGKYGDFAIGTLLNFMEKACGSLKGVVGMITGGANMLTIASEQGARIGEMNIDLARQMLYERGVRVIKEQVGGRLGVKLRYQNWDNTLQVQPIQPVFTPGPYGLQNQKRAALEAPGLLGQTTAQNKALQALIRRRPRGGI